MKNGKILLLVATLCALLDGCAPAPQRALFLSPNFRDTGIRNVALPPVSFERRYEPPYFIDLDGELRQRLRTALENKGYHAYLTQNGEREDGAELRVHVDFLTISETFSEREPPPVIDVEAEARLVSTADGKVLWRDRGGGRVGGSGGTRIRYPDADRYLALTLLAEHLLDTLPAASTH